MQRGAALCRTCASEVRSVDSPSRNQQSPRSSRESVWRALHVLARRQTALCQRRRRSRSTRSRERCLVSTPSPSIGSIDSGHLALRVHPDANDRQVRVEREAQHHGFVRDRILGGAPVLRPAIPLDEFLFEHLLLRVGSRSELFECGRPLVGTLHLSLQVVARVGPERVLLAGEEPLREASGDGQGVLRGCG